MSENEISHHIERLKESFLSAAARGGRLQECASLLELGAETEFPRQSTGNSRDELEEGNDGDSLSTRLESREHDEDTPLLSAVRNGHKDVAALLLAFGANSTRRDNYGNTVMHLAATLGDEGMASLFAPNASKLSLSTNKNGMTAIDIAVERGFEEFAEHLYNLCGSNEEKGGQYTSGTRDVDTMTRMNTMPSIEEDITYAMYESGDDSSSDEILDEDENDLETNSGSGFYSTSRDRIEHTSTSVLARTNTESVVNFSGPTNERLSIHSMDDEESSSNSGIDQESDGDTFEDEVDTDFESFILQAEDELGMNEVVNSHSIAVNSPSSNFDNNNYLDDDSEQSVNSHSKLRQLNYMTQLAHSRTIELHQAKYALNELITERNVLKNEIQEMRSTFCDDESNLTNKSLAELTSLEDQVRRSLDRIVKAKAAASNTLEDERTCLICRENPKVCLFLPCRHLCVCGDCGQRVELDKCPLCRVTITERINVFS